MLVVLGRFQVFWGHIRPPRSKLKVCRDNLSLYKTLCRLRLPLLRIQDPFTSSNLFKRHLVAHWLMILQINVECLLAADAQKQMASLLRDVRQELNRLRYFPASPASLHHHHHHHHHRQWACPLLMEAVSAQTSICREKEGSALTSSASMLTPTATVRFCLKMHWVRFLLLLWILDQIESLQFVVTIKHHNKCKLWSQRCLHVVHALCLPYWQIQSNFAAITLIRT